MRRTKEERVALRRRRANRHAKDAAANDEAAAAIMRCIPAGQPIIPGHHSEQRQRKELTRFEKNMDSMFENRREATRLEQSADRVENTDAIYNDDEDALPRLRERLAACDAGANRWTDINRALRSRTPEEDLGPLNLTEEERAVIMTPHPLTKEVMRPVSLSKSSAERHRLRARIQYLEKRAQTPPPPVLVVGDTRVEEADNRVRIIFPGKPDEGLRKALKGSGFRWAPSVGAWQRQASNAAWYEARRVLGALADPTGPSSARSPAAAEAPPSIRASTAPFSLDGPPATDE